MISAQKYWILGESTEIVGSHYRSKFLQVHSPVFMVTLVIITKKVCVYGGVYGNPTY